MITQVRIQNYKCLADVALELGPFNVLIGPNDTGKTSVLEALDILSRLTRESVSDAFKEYAPPGDALTHGSESSHVCFGASLGRGASKRELLVGVAADGRISCDDGTVPPVSWQRVLNSYDIDDLREGMKAPESPGFSDDRTLLGQLTLRRPPQPRRIGGDHGEPEDTLEEVGVRFIDALRVDRCDMNPRAIAAVSDAIAEGAVPSPGRRGEHVVNVLEHLLHMDRERFDAIQSRLREIAPSVSELSLPPIGNQRQIAFKLHGDRDSVRANLASDGLLVMVGYLALLYCPDSARPAMILIDEPENYIHPGRLKQVVELLREMCEKESVQIVMTTHSPYLPDATEPEEVHIFTRGGEEGDLHTKVTRMSDVPDIETLRKGYELGELWFNYGEEELIKGAK